MRALYKRLLAEGVDAWLDQEKLLPGQDWRVEIPRAVRAADVVVVCLSNNSITKEGYIQKELRFALDVADEKPEGAIFIIPARLEDCPVPDKLSRWHWVDLFEENGYAKLLRSLKKDAESVGAVIGLAAMEESDEERDRKIEQWYTEGLAAYYTEDWDRACQRFQMILREQPNHRNALEKLEEAELQRDLSKLYLQATQAYQAGNWQAAIQTLDELLKKKSDYRDSAQLLRTVRQQKQLNDLYTEAKKLHAAEKWQAVVRVFDQIHAIEPNYADADELLPSAQKELAEIKRLADLNSLYTQGIREMDSGKWYEARVLLEKVHKAQTGYLDTERLLRKVENEISKIEEQNRRNEQINILYEQAHGLVRSRNWRKAAEKIDEIRKFDSRFDDKDGLAEKISSALGLEEQEAQKQNQLAAMYADAVRLLKEEKYQEALDRWQEVRTIDPKYPDRQWVQRTAKRKLDELSRPEAAGKSWPKIVSGWMTGEANISDDREILIEGLLLLSFVVVAIIHVLWSRAQDWLRVWEWVSVNAHVLRFMVAALLGGLYGTVVAFALNKTTHNWQSKHSLTVIVGWALAIGMQWLVTGAFDTGDFFDPNLTSILFLLSGLATVTAIKWAKPATSPLSIIIILVGWAFAWWTGEILGGYLSAIYSAYYYSTGNALTVLLGLLFTFGIQSEKSLKFLQIALFGALGFAVGNYISYLADLGLPPPLEISFALWGLIGGAILELPSRDSRRIIFLAGVCGVGLLVGSFLAFDVLPVLGNQYANVEFSARNAILRQVFLGLGLGLALGVLAPRRASAIGVLVVLAAGIHMITRAINSEFFTSEIIWATIVRGGLIGLVMGYGYGYVRKADLLNSRLPVARTKLVWAGSIALATVALPVVLRSFPSPGMSILPTPLTTYRWDFNNSLEGWGQYNDLANPSTISGLLTFRSIGLDPSFESPRSLLIPASKTPVITVRMRVRPGQGTVGQIFFITTQDSQMDEAKSVVFSLFQDGTFQTYNILMSENDAWRGIVTRIRLDPVGDPTTENLKIEIDYISVHAP